MLVGATHHDTPQLAERMADKIWFLRVLDDPEDVMNRSLADVARDGNRAEALIVSQFTLYGNTDKGRRPSWIDAARPNTPSRWSMQSWRACERSAAWLGNRKIPNRDARRVGQRRPRDLDAGGVAG